MRFLVRKMKTLGNAVYSDWPVANSWYDLKWEHAADFLTAKRKTVFNLPSGHLICSTYQQGFNLRATGCEEQGSHY